MLKKIFPLLILIIAVSACNPDDEPINDNPNVDDRDKFVATWSCKESSKVNGISTFSIQISKDASSTEKVKIANFYQFGWNDLVNASVSGKFITIPKQNFCDHIIQGNGYIDNSGTIINWDYLVDDGSGKVDSCTAIYTKK